MTTPQNAGSAPAAGGDQGGGAAAAAPPPKTPHNAAIAPQERLSEDDQIIADLRAEWAQKQLEGGEEGSGEAEGEPAQADDKPAPKGKDKGKPKGKEASASAPAAPKYDSVDAAVAAIVKALESGDPEAIAKAVGKPKGFMDVSEQKWAAFREQKNAVRERERTVSKREHEFNQRYAEAKKELGTAINARKAYNDGDYSKFVELVNELIKDSGDTYDEAQRKVIKGELAIDPEVKKLRNELKAERAEREKREKAEREEAQKGDRKAQYERAVEAVRTELAGHPVSKVRGFEGAVLLKVRESWDGEDYTMSFEEAADEIVEERRAEAEALGYIKPAAPPAPKPKKEEPSPPPRSHAADARQPDGEEWEKRDLSDEEIIASIKRDVRAGRIKV